MNLNSGSPIKIAIQELIDSLDDINFQPLSSGIGLEEDRRVKKITLKNITVNPSYDLDSSKDQNSHVEGYDRNLYSKTSKSIVDSLDRDANVYRVESSSKNKGTIFNKILFKKKDSILNTEVLEPNNLEYDDGFYNNIKEKNDDSNKSSISKKQFLNIKRPFNYLSSREEVNVDQSDGNADVVPEDSSNLSQVSMQPSHIRTEVSSKRINGGDNNINLGSIKSSRINNIVNNKIRKPNIFVRFLAHGIDICVILFTLFISSILISKVLFPNMKNFITDNPLFRFILNMNVIEFVVIVYVLFIIYKYLFKTLIGATIGQFCFGIKSK